MVHRGAAMGAVRPCSGPCTAPGRPPRGQSGHRASRPNPAGRPWAHGGASTVRIELRARAARKVNVCIRSAFRICNSGARRAAVADSTCVRRGSSQHCSQLQDRLPGPPTHDLKAGLHHLSHREAYGTTWSSLGPSLAKSTFGRRRSEAAAGRSSHDFGAVKNGFTFTF